MRTFLLALLAMSIAVTLNAQFDNKAIVLGGQASYRNSKSNASNFTDKYASSSVTIAAGKAIRSNAVVGIRLGYAPIKNTNESNSNITSKLTGDRTEAGVFYRSYRTQASRLYFFGEFSATWIGSEQVEKSSSPAQHIVTKTNAGSLGVTPGLAYQLFKRLQVEVSLQDLIGLQYSVSKISNKNVAGGSTTQKQLVFGSNFGLANNSLAGVGIGFRFIF